MRYLSNYKPQRLMISNDDLGTFVVRCLKLQTSKQSVPSFASHNSVYRNIRLSLKSFTASSVVGPKTPSITIGCGDKPRAFNNFCSFFTSSPVEPHFKILLWCLTAGRWQSSV